MKVIATLVQYVEFEEKVDLSKVKNTDDWDELLVTKASSIDTHIKDVKLEKPKCPRCGGELREISMNGGGILFCRSCKQAYESEGA